MLNQDRNDRLTRVGPGTPMGNLLRRYWLPIAGVSEFETRATKPVRLLGEDLVLYKDLSGNFGLIDRHCAHRRADMAFGIPEACGLRCSYHGWLFDAAGQCTEQPYDDLASADQPGRRRPRMKGYRVELKAGLVWAYLGPEPVPLLPHWEPFTWSNGFVQIVLSEVPCNWLQCQENSIDPVHFEWTHLNWSSRLRGEQGAYAPRHLKVEFDEFEHGFVYRRILQNSTPADPLWTVGRVCLWPNALFTGDHFEWRVPIDDENTLSVTWHFTRVPREAEPYVQDRIPTWHGPLRDPRTGEWITTHVMNQDFVAWVGQGRIADRAQENLGQSDRGIAMIRRRFLADIEAVERGEDPKGVLRDPAANDCVTLPIVAREMLVDGLPKAAILADPLLSRFYTRYLFQAGQPAEVRDAFAAAVGIEMVAEEPLGI